MSHEIHITKVKESILSKDKQKAIVSLQEYLEAMKEYPELINWMVTPSNITGLHEDIMNNFEVLPKAMMLNKRVSSRPLRASLFVRAMINGLNRSK